MILSNWALFVAIIFATLDWACTWKGWKKRLYVAKPATVIFLALWTFQMSGWQGGMIWFGLALLFSLAGDVFLMLRTGFFMAGMAAFFLALVSYLIGFNQTAVAFTFPVATTAIIVGLAASAVLRLIRPGIESKIKGKRFLAPFFLYFSALTLMTLSALLCLIRPEWAQPAASLAAAGGVLFFTSDSMLSYDRFVNPIPHARFWVHLTYHLGQLGLIAGALLHFVP